ncbi:MAG: hypothetical protein R6V27_11580, partial [Balneolaceae bacterium]
ELFTPLILNSSVYRYANGLYLCIHPKNLNIDASMFNGNKKRVRSMKTVWIVLFALLWAGCSSGSDQTETVYDSET